jgi:hypothetical protein
MRKPATEGPAAGQRNPNPASDSVAHVQVRHLEKMGGWTRSERLRFLWYRLRLTVQEMNYVSRRMVELQIQLPGQPLDQHPDRRRSGR